MNTDTSSALATGYVVAMLIALLVPLILWIITLVSIVKSPNWTPGLKALWALAALPAGLVGMICWFAWGAKDGNKILNPPPAPQPPYGA